MNKQDQIHDDTKTESLGDLPLTIEQADEIKGGPAAARWSQIIVGDLPPAY